jgi:dihydroorotase
MKLLITNATVCDSQSSFNGKPCHVTITNGIISQIVPAGKSKPSFTGKVFDAKGAWLMPGLVDMRASLREPGYEFKEDLQSAAKAAAAGGYTAIAALPDTLPVTETKSDISFIKNKSADLPVDVLPYGAITKALEGKEMNELYDMHQAGAVGFSNANKSIMHAGVMMRAMMYAKIFNGLVLSHAEDTNLSAGGRMHEGNMSVQLGLKGNPNISEEVMIARDIELARYTNAPVHFSHISSKGSVELIKKAKKQGLHITCDVAVAHLIFTDANLESFDTNFKVNPPLRSKADQKALWDGLADGTVDCIVSDHQPQDVEHKIVEFEYASNGMSMLQTALPALFMHKPNTLSHQKLLEALTQSPRKILKQTPVSIAVGDQAELCIFDTKQQWELNEKTNLSKSSNNPFMGKTLQGKVLATIHNNQLYKHS